MKIEIRDYAKEDCARREELVNQAWDFDTTFQPQALSAIAKKYIRKIQLKKAHIGLLQKQTVKSLALSLA